ncbi:MAG: hypothetical protein ACYTXI_26630 [Nostoc sp.]
MAVAGAFTQAKTSTNNFLVIPQKIAKVNSLVVCQAKFAKVIPVIGKLAKNRE